MAKYAFSLQNRGFRLVLSLGSLALIGLLTVGLFQWWSQPALLDPGPNNPKQAALKARAHPTVVQLANLFQVRSAHAAVLDGELDTVADKVYGQTNFITNTTPLTATASSLNQPGDIAFYPQS